MKLPFCIDLVDLRWALQKVLRSNYFLPFFCGSLDGVFALSLFTTRAAAFFAGFFATAFAGFSDLEALAARLMASGGASALVIGGWAPKLAAGALTPTVFAGAGAALEAAFEGTLAVEVLAEALISLPALKLGFGAAFFAAFPAGLAVTFESPLVVVLGE